MRELSERDEQIVESYKADARALDRLMLPILVDLGLSMPQFKAMIAVTSAGPEGISVTDLGRELLIGQPSASLIADQLVRLGYAVRAADQADRRRVLVTATQLGRETTGDLRSGRRATFQEWLAELSDEDATALMTGLGALADAVQSAPLGRPAR
jgi:DNA-binding MarR family transcriptional regulator